MVTTKQIKEWTDINKWQKYFANINKLNFFEKEEINITLDQASAGLLLCAWNESCSIFLHYLKTSPSSPFKNMSSLFAIHQYQGHTGNLPHIHVMLEVNWT